MLLSMSRDVNSFCMVNPLNCATSAAWRILATTVAVTIKRAVTELDRIANIVLLLD
jgi:hypothetical protein